jgi:hypothetical protein
MFVLEDEDAWLADWQEIATLNPRSTKEGNA